MSRVDVTLTREICQKIKDQVEELRRRLEDLEIWLDEILEGREP
mgnify:CR=1 FL=1